MLAPRKNVRALSLLYEIYPREDHPLHEYLHHFVATSNTRASAALCELALLISHCRTDQFSRSFLPVVVRQNLLLLDVFSGGILSSLKSTELVPSDGLAEFCCLFVSVTFAVL